MILLTGASGFIGSHFLDRAPAGLRIRCLVRAASASKIKKTPSIEILEGDLLSPDTVEKAVQNVEIIIHLGALLRKSRPEDVYKVNVEGTRLLLEKAQKANVRRFVFVSTENAMREDLSDAYASSKRTAEDLVSGFKNSLILRPCFVYGPGDTHGLGRLVELANNSAVVPLFGGLKSQIQPIFIEDMVQYLTLSLQNDLRGAYVLAGPEKMNLNDFVRKVCELKKIKRFFLPVPHPLLKLLAVACDSLAPSSGWGMNPLNNIYKSRTYPIDKTVQDFKYSPRGITEGLNQWFGKSQEKL